MYCISRGENGGSRRWQTVRELLFCTFIFINDGHLLLPYIPYTVQGGHKEGASQSRLHWTFFLTGIYLWNVLLPCTVQGCHREGAGQGRLHCKWENTSGERERERERGFCVISQHTHPCCFLALRRDATEVRQNQTAGEKQRQLWRRRLNSCVCKYKCTSRKLNMQKRCVAGY